MNNKDILIEDHPQVKKIYCPYMLFHSAKQCIACTQQQQGIMKRTITIYDFFQLDKNILFLPTRVGEENNFTGLKVKRLR